MDPPLSPSPEVYASSKCEEADRWTTYDEGAAETEHVGRQDPGCLESVGRIPPVLAQGEDAGHDAGGWAKSSRGMPERR